MADYRCLHGLCGNRVGHDVLVHDWAVHAQSVLELKRLARIAAERFAECVDLLLYLWLRRRGALLEYTHVPGKVSSCLRVENWIWTRDCNLRSLALSLNASTCANLQDEA